MSYNLVYYLDDQYSLHSLFSAVIINSVGTLCATKLSWNYIDLGSSILLQLSDIKISFFFFFSKSDYIWNKPLVVIQVVFIRTYNR